MTKVITKNEAQTKKVAKLLAKEVILKPLKIKNALVFGLKGELGSGKTKFTQAFAKGLGIKRRLTSPTFVLIKGYKISTFKSSLKFHYLYHLDCYRLNKPKELLELDFKEIINDSKNILLIEWAEKVKKILPKNTIWIKFKIIDLKERKIIINF